MKVGMDPTARQLGSDGAVIRAAYCQNMKMPGHDEHPAYPESYGESAQVILSAMAKSEHHETASGMHDLDLSLTPAETGPFFLALMRAEAELLMSDADAFEPTNTLRTPEQRRVDALVEVVTTAAAALNR